MLAQALRYSPATWLSSPQIQTPCSHIVRLIFLRFITTKTYHQRCIEFANMSKSTTSLGNFTKTPKHAATEQQNMSNVILKSILKHSRWDWVLGTYVARVFSIQETSDKFFVIEKSTRNTASNQTIKVSQRTRSMKVCRKFLSLKGCQFNFGIFGYVY